VSNRIEKVVRMRIGVYTGSFNPIHHAHLRVVEIARETLNLDDVFIEACNDHYDKKELASIEDRVAMIEVAVSNVSGVRVGKYEASRGDYQPYTIETLNYYRDVYPDAEIFYICGGDVMEDMFEFHKAKKLFKDYRVICVFRRGYSVLGAVDVVSERFDRIKGVSSVQGVIGEDYSSTAIRKLIREGRGIRWLVPEGVREYILDNGIYKVERDNEKSQD
jgi:nicotinate-nucleotide adenylyltransferase